MQSACPLQVAKLGCRGGVVGVTARLQGGSGSVPSRAKRLSPSSESSVSLCDHAVGAGDKAAGC
jgi:hypothetical protein